MTVRIAAVLLLVAASAFAQGVTRTVLIGISEYRNAAKLTGLKYASRDAKQIAGTARLRRTRPVPLTDAGATQSAVTETLRRVLDEASPVDTVLIFLSGRGLALPDSPTGSLLTHESDPERLNTGVTIDTLDGLLSKTRAHHVILLLDVLRDPPEKLGAAAKNLINFALADLPKKHPILDVILASEKRQTSREAQSLGGGHGVFAHFFLEGLSGKADINSDGVLKVSELFTWVQARVSEHSAKAQNPVAVRSKSNATLLSAFHARLRDQPVLIASAGGWQMPSGPPADAHAELRAKAVKLEEEGQMTLVIYGEGDQLPHDPLKLGRDDFAQCEERFGAARDIRLQIGSADDPAVQSLEARQLFCRGRKLMFDGASAEAKEALRRSSELDGAAPEAWNAMGIAEYESATTEERSAEAVRLLEKAIERAPDWAYARHNLALARIRQGDFEGAIDEYRKAIRRTPYHAYLHYNLGALFHQLNRRSEARQAYLLALREFREQAAAKVDEPARVRVLESNAAAVENALGALALSEGRRDEARARFESAVHTDSLGASHYNLALLQAEDGQLSEAENSLRSALKAQATFAAAQLMLADLQRKQKRFEEALENLREAGDAPFVKMLRAETTGDREWSEGRPGQACSSWRAALENAPGDGSYRRDLERKVQQRCTQNSKRSIS